MDLTNPDDHSHHQHHHENMITPDTTTLKQPMDHHHPHHHHHHHIDHSNHHQMPMGGMSMGGMHMSGMSMGPMSFTLHTNSHFLFEGLRINTIQGIAIAISITVLVTVLYEGCNSFAVTHMARPDTRLPKRTKVFKHILVTLLKTFSTILGYIIMLAVMTYNVWILVAVILGSGISHFILRPVIYEHLKKHKGGKRPEDVEAEEVLHDFPPDEDDNRELSDEKPEEMKLMDNYSRMQTT